MQPVITLKEARQITGGRTPLIPLEYEQACNALQACLTIDDAKYWNDKADALAVWAKIYHDDKASRMAKQLKLRAFRKLGELAGELQKSTMRFERKVTKKGKEIHRCGGKTPGPYKLLTEDYGLSHHHANAARKICKIPNDEFEQIVNKQNPPSPTHVSQERRAGSDSWKLITTNFGTTPTAFRTWCRKNDPIKLAKDLTKDEAKKIKEVVIEITEWLDKFEAHLPK